VNPCIELTALRKKVRDLCAYVMDKKNKGRFDELVHLSSEIWNCACSRLELPNATRVAGFYRMIQSLVRNKHLLENAQKSDSRHLTDLDDLSLTPEEWISVSHIEAILKK
jgi:hypothetical protein